jgi:NAD(P)H-hydrate epimerase
LTRPLAGPWAELVARLAGRLPTLAVDLPSGLDADRPAPIGPTLPADLTVTFVALKPAHVLDPACDLCGEVVIADLGVPFSPVAGPGALHRLAAEELGRALPRRELGAHKGSFGHALLIAGSRGKAGAMVLAARAAIAGGAGLTTVALPATLAAELAAGCPEAMSVPLPTTPAGTFAAAALGALVAAAEERTAVAVGPGLGRDEETDELVRRVVGATTVPLVLDADGLNAFAGRLDALAARHGPSVLTPHPGELARLLGRGVPEIQADRLSAAREAAARSGAIVALKGRNTVVAAPDGEAWVNATGHPAMASGGSGDVLTGLLAARLAQGDAPDFAACLSVHLHGLAGELAADRLGGPAVPAGELLADLGSAFRRLDDES